MLVTTAGRTNNEMIEKAKKAAEELNLTYIDREKKTVKGLREIYSEDILVVGKERMELFSIGSDQPFFFHPNSASFRMKRVLKGETDAFIEAACLRNGMSLLDCTMGMASDSIIASHAVGIEGKVIGIEASQSISYLVKHGLKTWNSGVAEMDAAMNRIEVVHDRAVDYLKTMEDNSFDVVYFDPMFEKPIEDSAGISSMRTWAVYYGIDEESIKEAKRVAKERVILKEHYNSPLFNELGFRVNKRPSSKFHYGAIELHN
ncbi:MAG: class I SAM-dependent methyltransferase [Bacillota bacterium]